MASDSGNGAPDPNLSDDVVDETGGSAPDRPITEVFPSDLWDQHYALPRMESTDE